jgi:DNA-directed RNA polymerase subunit RPC12/RpoP
MKCQTCGGLIVDDQWNPGERKCQMCGRKVMETEKKTCIKCGKEFPATEEFFRKSSLTRGGFENQCKKCRKNYFSDYRRKKRNQPVKGPERKIRTIARAVGRPRSRAAQWPITTASPEAIISALRKGVAREIITIIEEKFGTA